MINRCAQTRLQLFVLFYLLFQFLVFSLLYQLSAYAEIMLYNESMSRVKFVSIVICCYIINYELCLNCPQAAEISRPLGVRKVEWTPRALSRFCGAGDIFNQNILKSNLTADFLNVFTAWIHKTYWNWIYFKFFN